MVNPNKFPYYHQPDQMDCGPTCLRMVAKHYGRKVSLEKLRKISETTRAGSSDLILNVKTKRDVTRFKAGAELSGKVNKMDVSVDEDITDEAQEWKITLVLTSERCSK